MLIELKNCKNIYDVADILQTKAKFLTYLLYVLPDAAKYSAFCISKKNGGVRNILAPDPRLKRVQRKLSDLLYECQLDLIARYGKTPAFGFMKEDGIFDNARCHRNRRWVFNIDLEDFFGSFNFGRVRGFLISNKDFALDPSVATYLAQLACFDNKLPQGAPSSPVLTNLICGSLDYRLSKFAAENRCSYTRYADDITFSTNLAEFPEALAVQSQEAQGWVVSPSLIKILTKSGFSLNENKTRMSYRTNRQTVTGLIVNQVPNVPREFYKNTRASIDALIKGKDVKIQQFCEPFKDNCEDKEYDLPNLSKKIQILEGRISHCHQIRNKNDNRKDSAKFFHPNAVSKDYADLLRFKYFVAHYRPLVVTEGLSDVLYLKAAMKASKQVIDGVVDIDGSGVASPQIDLYRYPSNASKLMGLSGGSGNIGLFLERQKDFNRRLSPKISLRPVIFLLDNDDGVVDLSKKIKTLFKIDVSINKDEEFYQIDRNIFIVKTPHTKTKKKTAIEDFLPDVVLKTQLNGKSFSGKSDFDESKFFGKIYLSRYVYDNYSIIDFTKFQVILERISKVVQFY